MLLRGWLSLKASPGSWNKWGFTCLRPSSSLRELDWGKDPFSPIKVVWDYGQVELVFVLNFSVVSKTWKGNLWALQASPAQRALGIYCSCSLSSSPSFSPFVLLSSLPLSLLSSPLPLYSLATSYSLAEVSDKITHREIPRDFNLSQQGSQPAIASVLSLGQESPLT